MANNALERTDSTLWRQLKNSFHRSTMSLFGLTLVTVPQFSLIIWSWLALE
jgi:hypothetical protein